MSRFEGPLQPFIDEAVLDVEAIVEEIVAVILDPTRCNGDSNTLVTLTKLFIEKERDLKELYFRQKVRESNEEELKYLESAVECRNTMIANVYEGIQIAYDALLENIKKVDATIQSGTTTARYDAERIVKMGFIYSRNYSVCGPKLPAKIRPYPTVKDFAKSQWVLADKQVKLEDDKKPKPTSHVFPPAVRQKPPEPDELKVEDDYVPYPMTIPNAVPIRSIPKNRNIKVPHPRRMLTLEQALQSIDHVYADDNLRERNPPRDTSIRLNIEKLIAQRTCPQVKRDAIAARMESSSSSSDEENESAAQMAEGSPEPSSEAELEDEEGSLPVDYDGEELDSSPEVAAVAELSDDSATEVVGGLDSSDLDSPPQGAQYSVDDDELSRSPQAGAEEALLASPDESEAPQQPLGKLVLKISRPSPASLPQQEEPMEQDDPESSSEAPGSSGVRTDSGETSQSAPTLSPAFEQAPVLSPAMGYETEPVLEPAVDPAQQSGSLESGKQKTGHATKVLHFPENVSKGSPDNAGTSQSGSPESVDEDETQESSAEDDDGSESEEETEPAEPLDVRTWDNIEYVFGPPPDDYEAVSENEAESDNEDEEESGSESEAESEDGGEDEAVSSGENNEEVADSDASDVEGSGSEAEPAADLSGHYYDYMDVDDDEEAQSGDSDDMESDAGSDEDDSDEEEAGDADSEEADSAESSLEDSDEELEELFGTPLDYDLAAMDSWYQEYGFDPEVLDLLLALEEAETADEDEEEESEDESDEESDAEMASAGSDSAEDYAETESEAVSSGKDSVLESEAVSGEDGEQESESEAVSSDESESDDDDAEEEEEEEDSPEDLEPVSPEYAEYLENRYFQLQEEAEKLAEEEETDSDSDPSDGSSSALSGDSEEEIESDVDSEDEDSKAQLQEVIKAFKEGRKDITVLPSIEKLPTKVESAVPVSYQEMKTAALKYSTQFMSQDEALLYRRRRLGASIEKIKARKSEVKAVTLHQRRMLEKVRQIKQEDEAHSETRYRSRNFKLPFSGKEAFPPAHDIDDWNPEALTVEGRIEHPPPKKDAQQAPGNNINYSLPATEFRTTRVDYPQNRMIPANQKHARLYNLMRNNPGSPNIQLCRDDQRKPPPSVESCDLTPDDGEEVTAQWKKAYEAEEATLRRPPHPHRWLESPKKTPVKKAKYPVFRPDMPRSYFMVHPRVRRARWNAKYGRYYSHHRFRYAPGVRQGFVYPHPRRQADPQTAEQNDPVDLCWNLRKWNIGGLNASFTNG